MQNLKVEMAGIYLQGKFVSMRMMISRRILLGACISLVSLASFGQDKAELKGWHLKDFATDGMRGISLQKAYEFLANKPKPSPIIVAVLDGGIDTTHEDLKGILWNNTRELRGNGIDDDRNGYPDDFWGWNFLGARNGENINRETAELIRVYHLYKDQFAGKNIDETTLTSEQKAAYTLWKQADKALEMGPEARQNIEWLEAAWQAAQLYDSVLQIDMNKPKFTVADLEGYSPNGGDSRKAKFSLLRMFTMFQVESDQEIQGFLKEMKDYLDGEKDKLNAKVQPVTLYRRNVTGDNEYNWSTRDYGNMDVMAGTPVHGTHVSGIIAAKRNNGLGMDGVAEHVRILSVRNVPNGDEYDKDVALGIRYAVDNGAKVINMSFGKEISPNKAWVDDALRYAAEKDVLVVHAAGNDGANIDITENYPSAILNDGSRAATMITVGASTDASIDGNLLASFSNYGKQNVDVFAPGVKIYSTVPHENGYSFQEGTSMAAPVVSGIAAIIRGYYPGLSAVQVREILEKSVDTEASDKPTKRPGSGEKPGSTDTITIREACKSGGIVNAYRALLMAEEMSKQKKK